ncbi:MAG: YkgJ family cysteine cluster protein [Deltaproteobacteria bacterium]|jgi:Fe-S-cluster containining protein|nr:YkgJ family cysteine cluster protein [Deltaproteobacteria bacterium]
MSAKSLFAKEKPVFHKEKNMFGKEKNPSNILPTKYTLDSRIKFRCHPGVSCFTECCGNIKIVLTPYDILQMRKRLDMEAAEFLHVYTTPTYLEKTDFPGVAIKLDEDGRCPFIKSKTEGCMIYSDRPTACRYYPVGMANFHEGAQEEQSAEEFYFVVKEPHCKGFEEDKTWTIREWRRDQGVDLRDKMNKGWMELVMRRKSFGYQATLSEQAKRMFFMASTDLEQFRSFVFDSSFLKAYEVDPEELDRIREDDEEMLLFSYRVLASMLFGTNDVTVRPDVLKARVEAIKKEQESSGRTMEERAERDYRKIKEEWKKEKEN